MCATTRVLFLGNSYTYYNNLPAIVTALAEAGGRRLDATMVAPGGWRLKDHMEKGEALRLLHSTKWDFVVLQEQSTLGTNLWVDGRPRVASADHFRTWVRKWVAEITNVGSAPVLYLTWARKASPEDQAMLTHAFLQARETTRALVAPVGLAWTRIRPVRPSLELYCEDGSHPSAVGSYLAACTIYATLFQASPVGLPATVTGPPVNLGTEQVESDRTTVLVDLAADDARAIQEAAWDSLRAVEQGDHKLGVAPLPALAPLPEGATLTPATLEGRWTGRLTFYPSGPADLTLDLHAPTAPAAAWRGHLQLRFHSKDSVDYATDVADLNVATCRVEFCDPRGLFGLHVRFHAVLNSGGLVGHAEGIDAQRDPPLRLIGTWKLARAPDQLRSVGSQSPEKGRRP